MADETRRQMEYDAIRRERWQGQQQALNALFRQWRQSAKVPRQTLDHFVADHEMRGLLERLLAWLDAVDQKEGFMLTGRVGNGKTHLVRGVAHEVRAQYRTVLYTSVPYLLEHLRGPTGADMEAVLKAVIQADVVVWDDLGAEKRKRQIIPHIPFSAVALHTRVNTPIKGVKYR